MIIFPGLDVGETELRYAVEGIPKKDILVIGEPGNIKEDENVIIDDFSDITALAKRIRERCPDPKYIFSLDEEYQYSKSKQLASILNIPFPSEGILHAATNKLVMKERFRQENVPCAWHTSSPDEARFPCILKTIGGISSEFLFKCMNKKELHEKIDLIKKSHHDMRFSKRLMDGKLIDPTGIFIMEEVMSGKEISMDILLCNGKVHITRVTKKYAGPFFGYFGGFALLNPSSITNIGTSLDELTSLGKKISKVFGIANGICMADIMITKDGPKVIEANIRPGLAPFIHLMHKLYGYTTISEFTKVLKGQEPSNTIPDREGIVVQLFAPHAGKIKEIDLFSGVPGHIETYRYYGKGDSVTDSLHSHHDLLLGYVIVETHEPDMVFELIQKNSRIMLE
ncbi:MAG: ATP-grasp domain-containing protein [Nanoarchaeota archaeon]|nr:ATP-grasp domain-containing protein [Nanoarchaeota archaeon]